MTERFDAIVVGAGHNGLVCASLLAKAGKSVLVLEAKDQPGGAAVTREFAPGFSVSACAHLLYQLQPVVQKELKLDLKLAADNLPTVVLAEDGRNVRYVGSELHGASATDVENYQGFSSRMRRFAGMLQRHLNRVPPRLGTGSKRDLAGLAMLGFDIRRLGKSDMREFLRMIAMNIHDELTERFESPLLRGGLSVDAVMGTHLGPRSPGTMLTYLYRLAGGSGRLALPVGGMTSVAESLASTARESGATIRTATPVRRIVAERGRVTGVETESGERFDSLTVISNADPKKTVMDLVGACHFETRFVHRVHNIRARGNAAKLHLALDGLPAIAGVDRKDFAARFLIAPDDDYVERAFNPAKYGEFSPHPVIEMTFPSVSDNSLAPTGKHVLSAIVQYAPYGLQGGWTEAAKNRCMMTAIETISRYVPDLDQRVTAREFLTPVDIEEEFHIGGGHWHHAELALDQFMFVRPVAGAAQYQLPLDGLFLCGAGAHPGGGVSGAAGRNAARAVLRREKIV